MAIIVPHLAIELTQRCNLNCAHCYKGDSKNVDISKEIVDRIFDEVKYVGMLDLSGGEVFLAYEELKMVLEKAKEKDCIIQNCSMIINGTIYDERIYKLLDEYFSGEKTYRVAISKDKYHKASIDQIYKYNEKKSNNPGLCPVSIDDVISNFNKHICRPSFIRFEKLSKHLINNGRAINLDEPSKTFEAEGYFYSYDPDRDPNHEVLWVGPTIFISADGWVSDINSEIERREEQSLGNIKEQSIKELVEQGGIKVPINSVQEFFLWAMRRERDFVTHQGPHLTFKYGKMALMKMSYDPKGSSKPVINDTTDEERN